VEVGQFYKRKYNGDSIYQVQSRGPNGDLFFTLSNLNSGRAYTNGCSDINRIFSNFRHLFELIEEEVTIIVG
jgi:hypothetical protein